MVPRYASAAEARRIAAAVSVDPAGPLGAGGFAALLAQAPERG